MLFRRLKRLQFILNSLSICSIPSIIWIIDHPYVAWGSPRLCTASTDLEHFESYKTTHSNVVWIVYWKWCSGSELFSWLRLGSVFSSVREKNALVNVRFISRLPWSGEKNRYGCKKLSLSSETTARKTKTHAESIKKLITDADRHVFRTGTWKKAIYQTLRFKKTTRAFCSRFGKCAWIISLIPDVCVWCEIPKSLLRRQRTR